MIKHLTLFLRICLLILLVGLISPGLITSALAESDSSGSDHTDAMSRMLEQRIAEKREQEQRVSPEWNFERAMEFYREGDYQSAADAFDRVLQLDAFYPEAASMRRKAFLMFYFGQYLWVFIAAGVIYLLIKLQEFINKYRKSLPRKNFNAALNKARKAASSRNWSAAINEAWKAKRMTDVDISMDHTFDLHLILARAYDATSKPEKAIDEASQGIKLKPGNPVIHEILVKSYVKTNNRSQDAMRQYKRWFQQKPGDRPVVEILTEEYLKIHLVNQDALDVYQKMLSWEPENPQINHLLAESYARKSEKSPQAMVVYEVVVKLEPENLNIRRLLFDCCVAFSRHDQAVEHGKYLIENGNDPGDTAIHKALLKIYDKTDKKQELLAWYRSLRDKFPGESTIADILGRIDGSGTEAGEPGQEQKKGQVAESSEDSSAFNICPECAHLNSGGETVCKGCGKPL